MQDRIPRVLKGHGAKYVEIHLEQSESTNLRYRGVSVSAKEQKDRVL